MNMMIVSPMSRTDANADTMTKAPNRMPETGLTLISSRTSRHV